MELKQKISGDMIIADIIEKYPDTAIVMLEYGFHCFGCHVNTIETLEQGAKGHGMPENVYMQMLKDLNKVAENGS